MSDTRITAVTADARPQMSSISKLLTDVRVNAGGITSAASSADNYTYGCTTGSSGNSLRSGTPHGQAAQDECSLDVTVTPLTSPLTSGASYLPGDSPQAGFLKKGLHQSDFEDTCVSGCTNVLVTVKDSQGQAVDGAQVEASVTHLGGAEVVNGAQGGGYLCDVGSIFEAGSRKCTTGITKATTDGQGMAFLRYWAPGVRAEVTTTISAKASKCLNSCPAANGYGEQPLPVEPHLFYAVHNISLAPDEEGALVEWHDNRVPSITNKVHLKAIDRMLDRVAAVTSDAPLRGALHALAKGVPLYGPIASFALVEWFQGKFHIADHGLTDFHSPGLADLITHYISNPILSNEVGSHLQQWLGEVPYADKLSELLGTYATNLAVVPHKSPQHMTMKLYEASFCGRPANFFAFHEADCGENLTAIHYNLYLAFSSAAGGTLLKFLDFKVTKDYRATDWIPSQCTSRARCEDVK